tara:strand:- start:71588 stop:71923 length:336 start_codon:yes stop_codon:yes gene_type:complete
MKEYGHWLRDCKYVGYIKTDMDYRVCTFSEALANYASTILPDPDIIKGIDDFIENELEYYTYSFYAGDDDSFNSILNFAEILGFKLVQYKDLGKDSYEEDFAQTLEQRGLI